MAPTINPGNGAPTQDTTIKIGDVTYALRWGVLNEYYADGYGVDVREFWSKAMNAKPGSISDHFKLFSAMVAHEFFRTGRPVPAPESWAAMCDEKPELTRAIFDAVKDVFLQKMKATMVQKLQASPPPAVQEQTGDVPQVEIKLN